MSKIMKIKHNTKRKKYIKKKKNDKTIKRRKYYLKKIRGGAPMTVNQRQNLITKYKIDLEKLLNKVKSGLTSVTTEKDFYSMIESKQNDINEIVDKYICILLMNDITSDTPKDKVVEEINKYIDESIIDLSKLRSKMPNLPPAFRLVQPKDIIPLFINKYTSRMDIIFKYIAGYIVSTDEKLDGLLFIFDKIYRSEITDETKSKLYSIIFKIYENKIKNFTDEVYTITTSDGKQRQHKIVTLMMILAKLESNFELIKYIVSNNADIQNYMTTKHKSIKDFIIDYGDIRYIKLTRTIPIYNYWNSLIENRTGMKIFEFKKKLSDYVKANDICRVIREQLPGFSPVDKSVIFDEFPYCYGFLLLSVASYLLQDKCTFLLMGGKSNQLALYDSVINLGNSEIVDLFYKKYLDMYRNNYPNLDNTFYVRGLPVPKNVTRDISDPRDIKNQKLIASIIKSNLENNDFVKEFNTSMKNIISQYKSYDIDVKVILNDEYSKKLNLQTPEQQLIERRKIARNTSLLIEWLSEENGFLKFKYRHSNLSSTYKIGYLSDNVIREKDPRQGASEQSNYVYYNNEQEYHTHDTIDTMSTQAKEYYESILNSKNEPAFVPKYYTDIIDVSYDEMDVDVLNNVDLVFGDFQGKISYRNLNDVIKNIEHRVSIIDSNLENKTLADKKHRGDLYYREKALKQLGVFYKTNEIFVLEMIRLIHKYDEELMYTVSGVKK
jgi:hypothetical protein